MKTCKDVLRCEAVVESNHRIANHMAIVSSYISLRCREVLKQRPARSELLNLVGILDGITAQIAAVAELHRLLTNDGSTASGDIGEQLGRICDAFRNGPAQGTTIEYAAGVGCILPLRHILPVSQIVSEVMTNALKHGRSPGRDGCIRVSCRRGIGGRVTITIDDNGGGMKPEKAMDARPSGIGHTLIASLVRQINGTLECRSTEAGVSIDLSILSTGTTKTAPGAGVVRRRDVIRVPETPNAAAGPRTSVTRPAASTIPSHVSALELAHPADCGATP